MLKSRVNSSSNRFFDPDAEAREKPGRGGKRGRGRAGAKAAQDTGRRRARRDDDEEDDFDLKDEDDANQEFNAAAEAELEGYESDQKFIMQKELDSDSDEKNAADEFLNNLSDNDDADKRSAKDDKSNKSKEDSHSNQRGNKKGAAVQ